MPQPITISFSSWSAFLSFRVFLFKTIVDSDIFVERLERN